LLNTYATTPSLKAGLYQTSAGDSLNVTTLLDGTFVIGGAKITKGNVLIKNGVVHYIDGVRYFNFTNFIYVSFPDCFLGFDEERY